LKPAAGNPPAAPTTKEYIMDNFYGTLRIYTIIRVVDPNSMDFIRYIDKRVNLVSCLCQYSERASMLEKFKKDNAKLPYVFAHFTYTTSVD
jgi:hypothetical protein